MSSPAIIFHAQKVPWFVQNEIATRKILTAEALDQQELDAGVLLHEAAQHPDSLRPESQHVRCHEEHSATTPLLPACESLVPLHVLPLHIFLPVKFPKLVHRSISTIHPLLSQSLVTTAWGILRWQRKFSPDMWVAANMLNKHSKTDDKW